ncbi:hypothetical protein CEXT_192261 [Caerostris extrusa]|uniref:Uncharacterized protein n=1 Tax=Caerostris extrusa TaxID=172846 RepID=A0AAV4W3W0_CAEEX|nr:hypothetical protein CEXT_192261 [Caerostris extrusa]
MKRSRNDSAFRMMVHPFTLHVARVSKEQQLNQTHPEISSLLLLGEEEEKKKKNSLESIDAFISQHISTLWVFNTSSALLAERRKGSCFSVWGRSFATEN